MILAAVMMIRSSSHHMRHRAQLQDDGQRTILALVVIATIASLAAIGGELAVVKDMHGFNKAAHIALAGVTVLSSWAFIQIMFALHYAHDFYAAACHGRPPGLQFPEEEHPDYGDFFYFAAVIGTSGQTADISFVSKPLRRIGTLHCILSYLFNTTVLALLINIGASMFWTMATLPGLPHGDEPEPDALPVDPDDGTAPPGRFPEEAPGHEPADPPRA